MRIAVTGAAGQLGSELIPRLGSRGIPLGHDQIEITDATSVASVLDVVRPTHVVNCAAYNLVDRAEDEPEVAYQVNACGTRHLARWCAANHATLLHVSTDYVFGLETNSHVPWRETDATGPVSAYGLSKLAGEYFVRAICPRHLIVRTCGLYGHNAARGKGNFIETMLRLARERSELRIVDDQRCTPTSVADLAVTLVSLIESEAWGIYHATNSGECSWFQLAAEIFRLSNITIGLIPSTAAEYGAKARRPDYSVLDCSKLTGVTGSPLPAWQDAVARYLHERAHR